MKKKIINCICIVFSFTSILLNAQEKKALIDSSFNYLGYKYYEYKFKDSLKSKIYSDIYLKKALKEKDTLNIIDGYAFKSEVESNDSIFIDFFR
jgi:hypothetical protein